MLQLQVKNERLFGIRGRAELVAKTQAKTTRDVKPTSKRIIKLAERVLG